MYLGADIKKWSLDETGQQCWAMSSDSYVKRAIGDVEAQLLDIGKSLSTRVTTPMSTGYRPELDATANYYQGLIGVLRWMCELGRVDILVDVSLLSRFLAAPRVGHLDQVFHIFAYLKADAKSSLI
jgi:hypothetical protein